MLLPLAVIIAFAITAVSAANSTDAASLEAEIAALKAQVAALKQQGQLPAKTDTKIAEIPHAMDPIEAFAAQKLKESNVLDAQAAKEIDDFAKAYKHNQTLQANAEKRKATNKIRSGLSYGSDKLAEKDITDILQVEQEIKDVALEQQGLDPNSNVWSEAKDALKSWKDYEEKSRMVLRKDEDPALVERFDSLGMFEYESKDGYIPSKLGGNDAYSKYGNQILNQWPEKYNAPKKAAKTTASSKQKLIAVTGNKADNNTAGTKAEANSALDVNNTVNAQSENPPVAAEKRFPRSINPDDALANSQVKAEPNAPADAALDAHARPVINMLAKESE